MGERRLAAIMFTDMVGYSALTQRSEETALELLEEHRRVLRPVFAAHGGRVISTTGDGFLLEFASALSAVRCAVEAQRALGDRNAAVPPARRVQIRIGIHVGDVVFTDGDVQGDGVNIAARLEPFAEPGGICVSQQVYDQVSGKIDQRLEPMGKPALKNIRTPIEVYRVVLAPGAGAVEPGASRPARAEGTDPPAPPRSIAVLPLANLSPDPENEYFSDGLTDDILAHLSKIRGLKVISRTSAMQYKRTAKNVREIGRELGVATVLEGSVRRVGNTVRISVQLIDAGTDEHLWADTYDRELADIFAIQSDVARSIAGALQAHTTPEERARIDRRPTANVEAYQAYLRGLFLWNQRTDASVNAGIEEFRRAIALDPEYAPAHVGLADAFIVLGNFGTYRPDVIYPTARAAALRALEIDEALGDAHASLAQVKVTYDWDWTGAERAFLRALDLRPGSANAHHWYALYLSAMGRFDQALLEIHHALELDPFSATIAANVAAILFSARRYEEALAAVRTALRLNPEFRILHHYHGIILLLTGAHAEALAALQRADEPAPAFNVMTTAMLGYAYARLGQVGRARAIAAALADRYDRAYASPVWIAFLHEGLGDRAQTLAWLDRARRDRDGWLRLLRTSPFFDDIRGTPEYRRALETMGLAPAGPAGESS